MVCARSPYSGFKLRFSMYASQTHYLARKIVCYSILQWRLRPLRARAFRRRAPVGSRVFDCGCACCSTPSAFSRLLLTHNFALAIYCSVFTVNEELLISPNFSRSVLVPSTLTTLNRSSIATVTNCTLITTHHRQLSFVS